MRSDSHRKTIHQSIVFILILLLVVQTALPVFAQSDSPLAADRTPSAKEVSVSGLLYRTQIQVSNTARWQRLEELEIAILTRTDDAAVVLVDDQQLERLAALGFRPQQTEAVESMVEAQAQPWLARSLQPLLQESSTARSRVASDDQEALVAARTQLRAAMTVLTTEQRQALADLTSLDDDGDGLSNTQEGWWCTDPLDADSDNDGKSDGVEIAALKAWMNNERDRAPGETPWMDWPFGTNACPDKDFDAIPNDAERWELGLNQDRESTDRDRYDDGQELFGTTYCPNPSGYCGYGSLPRNADWGVVFAEMPTWVKAPSNHPLVAAFPVVKIDLVADTAGNTFRVETVTTITSDKTVTTGTTHSYSTESSRSVSTGVEDTITFNDYIEVSKSYEDTVTAPSTLQRDLPPTGLCNIPGEEQACRSTQILQGTPTTTDQMLQEREMNLAPEQELCSRPYDYFSGVDPLSLEQLTSIGVGLFTGGGKAGLGNLVQEIGKNIRFSEGRTYSLECGLSFPSWTFPYVDQSNDSDVIPAIDDHQNQTNAYLPVEQRGNSSSNSDKQVIVNNNFDTASIVRGLDGIALTYKETGELIGREIQNVSMSVDELTNAVTGGLGEVSSGLNTIAAVLAAPTEITTTLKGSSHGGAQTTSHTQIQAHSVITGEAFLSQESWGQATAVNAAHAADLWFTYDISNQGTEYALDICDVAFNIYINNLSLPAYTHYVGSDRGGDTCFSNFMAGESHRYTTKIPLSLEQLKAIDLSPACSKGTGQNGQPSVCPGGKVSIALEDYTYGADSELLYQDAANSGVVIALEDGTDDGQEEINTYLMPTWGADTILDVITHYFPVLTDEDGDIVALWSPEDVTSPPDWCQAPRVVGSKVWCRHALSTAEWWNVYTANLPVGGDGYENSPAVPGSVVFFRFNQDSDWDGYNDRIEVSLGTDPDNSNSFPYPELIAGLSTTRVGNQVTGSLSMLNLGLSDAFAISAVMVAPDDSITVNDNAVGGSGRVRAQTQVNVGAVVKLQEPIPAAWYQTAHARVAAGGFYVGTSERTYTFTTNCTQPAGCQVGSGDWTLAWNDGAGNSGTLPMGATYSSPQFVAVGGLGVRVALAEGAVANGDSFSVIARPSPDTFQYTVNQEPYTPPMVIVSYNEPKGNHRFVIPLAATNLDDPVTQLRNYRGQMLHNVGVDIFTVGAVEAGTNTTNLIVSNPTDAVLADAHLILEFVDADGQVVHRIDQQTDLPPGPQVRAVTWDTGQFSTPYNPDQGYLLMAFLTDYQSIVLDRAAKPMAVYSTPEQLRKVFVVHTQRDVGTVPWPETFAILNSQMGGSFTSSPLKQSPSYRLQGSTGAPVWNQRSASSIYGVQSGFWATIQAWQDLARVKLTSRTAAAASDSTDAVGRFPTQRYTLVNQGLSPLQLRVANLDNDITLIKAPAQVLGSGEHTDLEIRLNTNNLGVGPISKSFSVFTNDPTQPEIPLTISGTVQRNGDLVFVRDSQSDVQPLTKIVRVNSARNTGNKVTFQHSISADMQNLYPLFVIAGNETTELGQGEVLAPTTLLLSRLNGDAAMTELVLPEPTSTRRDYVIRYGYRSEFAAANSFVYQVPVPFKFYDTFVFDIIARSLAAESVRLTIDIGNNGSAEWESTDLNNAGQTVTTENLAQAVNAYLDSLNWSEGSNATVPIKFTSNTPGTYFLTNVRGSIGSHVDLSVPSALQVSNATPIETDSIQLCTTVRNDGKSTIAAAIVDFIVRMPDANASLQIGYDIVTDLPGFGGEAQSCIDWNTRNFDGDLPVYAVVDFRNEYIETTETNNGAEGLVTVLSRPDLFIPQITLADPEPVVGQPVEVRVSVGNRGSISAGASTTTLFEHTSNITATISSGDVSVPAGDTSTVTLVWTPSSTGWNRLYAVSDQNNSVSERHEKNNSRWIDVYVGFADSIQFDSGNPNSDPIYTDVVGFGVVDVGQPDDLHSCGTEDYQTYRRDPDGQLQYRFDHLLLGHFYHLDVTLYNCPGDSQRLQTIAVDGNLVTDSPIDLGDSKVHKLSYLLDPALYADRSVMIAIMNAGINGAVISGISLHDVYYRYADAGGTNDPNYSSAIGYGALNGVRSTVWGGLPHQSVRVSQSGNRVEYRFDGLRESRTYRIHTGFFQRNDANRVQQIEIDGIPVGPDLTITNDLRVRSSLAVPANAYKDDGSVVISIVRKDATDGAMVNEIALEEETTPPQQTCTIAATPYMTQSFGNVTIEGHPAPVGSVITAENGNGEIAGCFVVNKEGIYGFMPIYGADNSASPTIPGMTSNEPVLFRVNGALAVASPVLLWQEDNQTHPIDLAAGGAEMQSILLSPGWNLFSLRVQPPVVTLSAVMNSIKGHYCYMLGALGKYDCTLGPEFQTLKEVHPGPSYYVRLEGNVSMNLLIPGTPVDVVTPIEIQPGWNWIGYYPQVNLPVDQALSNIDGSYLRVIDGQGRVYDPTLTDFNTLAVMEPGAGYLLFATEVATLVYPTQPDDARSETSINKELCTSAVPTPLFTFLYGDIMLNGVPASAGTRVDVLNSQGTVTGCFITQSVGRYGFMPVYGKDQGQPPLPGMASGETLTIRINGQVIELPEVPNWQDDKANHRLNLAADVPMQIFLPLIGNDSENKESTDPNGVPSAPSVSIFLPNVQR